MMIVGLGFAASATEWCPDFDEVLRGNKVYLAAASLLGLVAFVARVVMLWSAGGTAPTVLMAAVGVFWIIATTHHTLHGEDKTVARLHRCLRASTGARSSGQTRTFHGCRQAAQ